MIWVILAAITLVSIIILLAPMVIATDGQASRGEKGVDVYKQQLNELDADVTRGVLSEEDAETARVEIQRRIIRDDKEGKSSIRLTGSRQPVMAVLVLVFVVGTSFAFYSYLGSPDLPSKPLASRDIKQEKKDFAGRDLSTLVARLAKGLQEKPDNLDGWILLARTLSRMGRFDDAANTYLQAVKITPGDADLYVAAGENFYYFAKGTVSDLALDAFKRAAEIDPKHAGARYYLAVSEAQNGREAEALDQWISLYRDSEATAPFMRLLRKRISEAGARTGRDVAAILAEKPDTTASTGPSSEDVKAAAGLSPEDQQKFIETMVARLADRMAEAPDFDGLMKLGKAYSTLRKYKLSADAYARAAGLKPDVALPLVMQALAIIQDANAETPPAEAIALYRKVLALDDKVAEAHWYVGIDEATAGRTDKALSHWRKIQTLVPKGTALYANVTRAINALSPKAQN